MADNSDFAPTPIPDIPDLTERKTIRQEYDIYIKELTLITWNGKEHDLLFVFSELNIYEDIFHNVMSGSIELKESNDLPNLMPLIGEEKLRIVFTRPDDKVPPGKQEKLIEPFFRQTFRIYKMDERKRGKAGREQTYVFYFSSFESVVNHKKRIRRTFEDKLYSEMVQIIYDDEIKIEKPIRIEETTFEHDYALSKQRPFKFFNEVASRSLSPKAGGSAYVFYEDHDKFNYISLYTLMEEPPKDEYYFRVANIMETNDYRADKNRSIELDVRSVEYHFTGSYDIMENLANGMYAGRLFTYDYLRKKWTEVDNDLEYFDAYGRTAHLSSEPLATDGNDALGSPLSYFRLMSTNKDHDIIPHIVAKEPGIKPFRIEETILLRASQFQQINNQKLRITLTGDPRRRAGDVIKFILPKSTGDIDKPPKNDQYLTGKFLITSLRHRISSGKYVMEMEIIKDSYLEPPQYIDPKSLYGTPARDEFDF